MMPLTYKAENISRLCLGKLSPDPNNRKQHPSLNVSKFTRYILAPEHRVTLEMCPHS